MQPSAQPLVSVVVPAFNAARYVEAALRSVLAQDYRHLEVFVVDDGSSDDTVARAGAVARMDDRVQVVSLERNSGCPAVARNAVLARARGELVAFLDADDLWTPRKLSEQVAALSARSDLAFVYSMLVAFGAVKPLQVEYGVKPLPFRAAVTREALVRENTIGCSSVLARLAAVRAVGGFDEDPGLAAVEDYDLWLRLGGHGGIGFLPRVHGYYRIHPSSLSRSSEMSRRTHFLFEKRAIAIDQRRQVPRRGLMRQTARAVVHTAVIARAGLAHVAMAVGLNAGPEAALRA